MDRPFVVPTKQQLKVARYSTTIYLNHAQRVAIEELRLRRMEEGKKKPTMREILVEGLMLLLKKEKIKLDEY